MSRGSLVVANSASAAASTGTTAWWKGSTEVTEGIANGLPIKCGLKGSELTISTTAGTLPLKLKATGVSCSSAKIYNQNAEGIMGLATAVLEFTGVSLVEPEPTKCAASKAAIETKSLFGQLYMDGSKSDLKLTPTAGASAAIGTFEITGAGCPVAGIYKITGSVFGQEELETGHLAVTQNLSFSKTINETAGGSLLIGGKAASIQGGIGLSLAAPNLGAEFKSE